MTYPTPDQPLLLATAQHAGLNRNADEVLQSASAPFRAATHPPTITIVEHAVGQQVALTKLKVEAVDTIEVEASAKRHPLDHANASVGARLSMGRALVAAGERLIANADRVMTAGNRRTNEAVQQSVHAKMLEPPPASFINASVKSRVVALYRDGKLSDEALVELYPESAHGIREQVGDKRSKFQFEFTAATIEALDESGAATGEKLTITKKAAKKSTKKAAKKRPAPSGLRAGPAPKQSKKAAKKTARKSKRKATKR